MKLKFTKINRPLFYIGCIFLLNSCEGKHSEDETDIGSGRPKDLVEAVLSAPEPIEYDLTYVGILPCKDCGGIKTTVKLSTKLNKFSMKEEFLKTEIAPSLMLGHFNTERGFEKDEDATVYVFNDELPEADHLFFVRETGKDAVLLKLDNSKQRTNYTNFSLAKVSE